MVALTRAADLACETRCLAGEPRRRASVENAQEPRTAFAPAMAPRLGGETRSPRGYAGSHDDAVGREPRARAKGAGRGAAVLRSVSRARGARVRADLRGRPGARVSRRARARLRREGEPAG